MIGDGQAGHAEGSRTVDQRFGRGGAVEKGVIRVAVQFTVHDQADNQSYTRAQYKASFCRS